MESTISNALQLLAIGMTTVFLILALVVLSGNILIKLVNKFAPEPVKKASRANGTDSKTAPEIIAAITAVVETITQGRGKIEDIKEVK